MAEGQMDAGWTDMFTQRLLRFRPRAWFWEHNVDPDWTCLLTGWVGLAKSLDLSEP